MNTVSKREAKQCTAEVLDRVTEGGDIVVAERGKPRWTVSVFREPTSPLLRVEGDGRCVPPASRPASWPSHPGGARYTDAEVDVLRGEMRGDH